MRVLFAVVVLGLLLGCTREYRTFEPAPLDYADRTPIELAVDRIAIESTHQPQGAPFVEHTLVLAPEEAARRLLERRLQAVGGPGSLRAVIEEASVEQQALETQAGLKGWLTTEAEARLRGKLRVRIERLDERGNMVGAVTTAVTRSKEIAEGTPYVERQELAYQLVLDLVDDLDAGLIANIEETFAALIRP